MQRNKLQNVTRKGHQPQDINSPTLLQNLNNNSNNNDNDNNDNDDDDDSDNINLQEGSTDSNPLLFISVSKSKTPFSRQNFPSFSFSASIQCFKLSSGVWEAYQHSSCFPDALDWHGRCLGLRRLAPYLSWSSSYGSRLCLLIYVRPTGWPAGWLARCVRSADFLLRNCKWGRDDGDEDGEEARRCHDNPCLD